jgi:hypothetical protein
MNTADFQEIPQLPRVLQVSVRVFHQRTLHEMSIAVRDVLGTVIKMCSGRFPWFEDGDRCVIPWAVACRNV